MTYQGVTVLYDMVRWEEKSLAEASKKIGAEVRMQDCRESRFDLDGDYPEFGTVLQRCVSYYRNVHSTAALEGAGCMVINPLKTGIYAGNKLYSHMLLRIIFKICKSKRDSLQSCMRTSAPIFFEASARDFSSHRTISYRTVTP